MAKRDYFLDIPWYQYFRDGKFVLPLPMFWKFINWIAEFYGNGTRTFCDTHSIAEHHYSYRDFPVVLSEACLQDENLAQVQHE